MLFSCSESAIVGFGVSGGITTIFQPIWRVMFAIVRLDAIVPCVIKNPFAKLALLPTPSGRSNGKCLLVDIGCFPRRLRSFGMVWSHFSGNIFSAIATRLEAIWFGVTSSHLRQHILHCSTSSGWHSQRSWVECFLVRAEVAEVVAFTGSSWWTEARRWPFQYLVTQIIFICLVRSYSCDNQWLFMFNTMPSNYSVKYCQM